MKVCFKCGQAKSLDHYYAHPRMADGHLNKCKDCTRKDTKDRSRELMDDPAWVESEKARARNKYHRLGYGDKHKPSAQMKKLQIMRHKEKYPEKYAARIIAQRLERPNGTQLHHWSYRIENAKDVICIAPREHYTLHRFLTYEPEQMCYRTIDGELLDTRDKHVAFLKQVIPDAKSQNTMPF